MIRSHGGSKDIVSSQRGGGIVLGGILRDTTMNSPKAVHMKSLEKLIGQTTGVPREKPIMDGVIAATVPSGMRDTPELMPNHDKNMSDSKMAVGGTYAGPKSGYGMAEKSVKHDERAKSKAMKKKSAKLVCGNAFASLMGRGGGG
jgi:hypothetical protein